MKRAALLCLLLMVSACMSGEERSCGAPSVTTAQARAACIARYRAQHTRFRADRAACLGQAKEAIPDYLYDYPHFEQDVFPDDYGVWRTQDVLVEDDFFNNAPLEKDRRMFMDSCMRKQGWKSAHWGDQSQK